MGVQDQGVGVHPGEQKYLFEPFFTGFDTLHHSSGEYQFGKRGIGLGLCLVKTFVELHGGRVEVPGARSWLDLRIPLATLAEPATEARPRKGPVVPRAVEAGRELADGRLVAKIIGVTECSSVDAPEVLSRRPGQVLGSTLDVIAEVAEEGGEPHVVPGLLDRLLEPLILGLELANACTSAAPRSRPATWSWVLTESMKPAEFGQVWICIFMCG